MGAKRGRTKGNEQRTEYENLEGRHERSGWRERGNRGSESGDGHWGSNCEAEPGRAERKKQRLSSELLKRKRTERKRKSGIGPGEEIRKGITCGTAAGAKQGRTKGNEQQSQVREPGKKA